MTDKEVKDALAAVWQAGADSISEPIRIVKRWKFALKGKEVMSALRSLTTDRKVNGLYITRAARSSRKVGMNHYEYKWRYAMVYFRSYEDGTDADNSEDRLNTLLEAVAEEFENTPGLNLPFVDDHSEIQVESIDTVDLRVHAAQCFIDVNITKQP